MPPNIPQTSASTRSILATLFLAWLLLFWAQHWDAAPKLDGMTYATLARNILHTGDWKTLHWADSAYANFYQHPPLAIWMEAWSFRLFGISNSTVRILPSIFGLGTLSLIFLFCRSILGSAWLGFLSCLVLLTSTRYVKFASDFYLDGPLAFWMFLGAFLAILFERSTSRKQSVCLSLGYGLALAFAFLTKGLVAFGLPLSLGLYSVWRLVQKDYKAFRRLSLLGSSGVGVAALSLVPWFLFGDGVHYLQEYWRHSVSYRVSTHEWRNQLIPTLHLMKVYWPWWPILLWSAVRLARSKSAEKGPVVLLGINAAIIVLAFSYVGHSIEHYFIPFYVFGAIVVAWPLAQLSSLSRVAPQVVQGTRTLCFLIAVLFTIWPVSLHVNRAPALREALSAALKQCSAGSVQEVLVTERVDYLWFSLAVVHWETPWQGRVIPGPVGKPHGNQLLIAREDELLPAPVAGSPGWVPVPYTVNGKLRIFQPAPDSGGMLLCPGLK